MTASVKFACVFPGQGSQSIGMMKGYADFPVVRETFDEASSVLGQDFWTLVNDGSSDELNLTVNTQPLMLMAGIAVYRAWQSLGDVNPAVMAGHSLGEYTALVASGALAFSDALSLVRFRAEVMQQAVPEGAGAMAAILGLDDEVVRALCDEITSSSDGELLEPANFNSPGQIVDRRPQKCSAARDGTGQVERREACTDVACEHTFALFPDEPGGRADCMSSWNRSCSVRRKLHCCTMLMCSGTKIRKALKIF